MWQALKEGSMINWQAALSVWDFLKMNQIEDLSIKWPNDILSDKKKIAGILIEPKIGQNSVKSAIIGVGLNVNQESFPDELSNATSILMARQRQTNLDLALDQILDCLSVRFKNPELWNFESIKAEYESKLFNRNRVMVFEHLKDAYKFNAIIKGVDNKNLLVLELESGEKSSFDLQSLKWYY
jgi:BirA family biotin operon repressor/biotin-[acetyl-CoA-carboxylase] ligase